MDSFSRDRSPERDKLEAEFKKLYMREKELEDKIKEFEKMREEKGVAGINIMIFYISFITLKDLSLVYWQVK